MSTTTAVVASLGSAATFGAATVLQARSAAASPQIQGMRPAQVGAFLGATLSHPLVCLGLLAAGAINLTRAEPDAGASGPRSTADPTVAAAGAPGLAKDPGRAVAGS